MKEMFVIDSAVKKKISLTAFVGLVLLILGIVGLSMGKFDPANEHAGHGEHHSSVEVSKLSAEYHDEAKHDAVAAHAEEGHGHHYSWTKRIKMAVWHNSVFFIGISVVGLFFLCVNYAAWAGWSSSLIRVMQAMGYYLYVGGPILIISFFAFNHDIFHWTDASLYDPNSANYDPIIAGKQWYLTLPFYVARLILIPAIWILFHKFMVKKSELEDQEANILYHNQMINISAGFLVFFGVSSSLASWDWVMSIDTHWFSTLFGWYAFASWFVSGLAVMILTVLFLKDRGYLEIVNENHIHDLGKFMFAFSIFWTYLWFSQFLLYWYSNIPEETIWFVERLFLNDGVYRPLFITNLVINFLFPFFFLMTRDAKRTGTILKVAAWGLLLGHWVDFYLMMMPGTLGNHGGFNLGFFFVELGMTMLFSSLFIGSLVYGLSRLPLIAKNHPYLQESKHHHI